MSDYSAVAPPPQQNFNQSSAFAAALQRAKQIAAKINPGSTNPVDNRQKRALEDGPEPDAKKGPGSSGPPPQIPPPGSRPPPSQGGMGGPAMGGGPQLNEDIKVPDKMVGLSKYQNKSRPTKIRFHNISKTSTVFVPSLPIIFSKSIQTLRTQPT
jgi:far upstream element-binding protein